MKKKISMLSKLQVFNNNLWFGEIELLQLYWVFEDIFFSLVETFTSILISLYLYTAGI